MSLFTVGFIYFIYFAYFTSFSLGAFVEIGNLPATKSIHEDTTTSVLVFSVSVYPPSTGTCGFASGNDGNFVITDIGNGEQQVWTSASCSFSSQSKSSYALTVECPDGGGPPSDSQVLTVNINANADFTLTNFIAGVATTSASAKTVKSGHVIFTVEYTDPDGDSLTNTITSTNPNGAPFAFDGDHVVATDDLLEERETLYTLYFDATDGRNTQNLELQITITDVNTPPKITNLNFTIALEELQQGRQWVFTINYQDNDGDAIQMEIVSKQDVDEVFDIVLSSGEVYIKDGFELDYETTTQYYFELTIKDEYHYTNESNKFLVINVLDINETPYWPSKLDNVSVEESAAGVVVGTPSALCDDPDGAVDVNAMKYRIVFGTYSSYFSINQTTAEVSFASDWDYDDKTLPETLTLTLECEDPDGASASADYDITILDVNDNTPVCNPFKNTLSLTYAQAASESITHLNCSDADSNNNAELEYSVYGLDKGYGNIYFNIDTTGNVTITKEFEMDYNTTFYVTVEVKDKGNTPLSTTVTLTVTYTERPTVANWTEVTTDFLSTTAAVALVSAAGLVMFLLCTFLGTLLVLWLCYSFDQWRMKSLIASGDKGKSSKKHRRRRKKHTKALKKDYKNMMADEKTYTQELRNQYNGAAPPGTVMSSEAQAFPQARADISQPAEDSQWNKFRKKH